MSTISKPYTFANGAVILAAEHNSNFDTVYNDYNGNITNSNISGSASIDSTKLNLATVSQAIGMSNQPINFAKGGDIASAATTDIGAATGNVVDVTGTTTITALGTVQAGTVRFVRFTGALTLTYNATSLILPTSANITTAAGDTAIFVSLGSGNWRCDSYNRLAGTPLVSATASTALSGSVIQMVNTTYTTASSTATTIPYDTSIPQNTEGAEFFTRAITPNHASNLLRIDVVVNASSATLNDALTAALFQDSTANALIAGSNVRATNGARVVPITFTHWMTAGTTSSTTFKVRCGAAGGTLLINQDETSVTLGGKFASTITITEIKA